MGISVNKKAMEIVREMIADQECLGLKVTKMDCGATVIDAGVEAAGSFQAGLMFNEILMGGLGISQMSRWDLDDEYSFGAVDTYITDTVHGILMSQLAGWPLESGPFAAIGSGPARALARRSSDPYVGLSDYQDNHHEAVLCIQTIHYPTEEMAISIGDACNIKVEDVYLVTASNACIVGAMQIAGRSVEQIYHKMVLGGISPESIKMGRGVAPIAPLHEDQVVAMGRINDAITYGAHSEFWVDCDDEVIAKVLPSLTAATSSPYYPELFEATYRRAEMDFFNMDPDGDSGARVQIHNIVTGKVHFSGAIRRDVIRKSFLE